MAQSSDEETKEVVRELVRKLFNAENDGAAEVAEKILAADYLPIIRGKGQVDRNRKDTLGRIGSANKTFHRHVDQSQIEVDLFADGGVAIARSLLPTTNSEAKQPDASFRNLHVFLKRVDGWKCVAWQVTKVDP